MLEDYIVSFTDGRIRLRHPALHDEALGKQICTFLAEMNGIQRLEHKSLTGSLLIHYDAENISQEDISALLSQGQEWLEENAPEEKQQNKSAVPNAAQKVYSSVLSCTPCQLTAAQKRKIIHRSMIATFFATLLSGGVGNKKAHYMAGGAFALLTLAHLWRMRKII